MHVTTTLLAAGMMALALAAPLHAHEGHDHGEPAAAAPAASATAIVREASSARHELVVHAPLLLPGAETRIELYLNDWATNAPVSGAVVQAELRGRDSDAPLASAQAQQVSDGVYAATLTLPEAGVYNLLVRTRGAGAGEEFAFAGLVVEQPAPAPAMAHSPMRTIALATLGLVVLVLAAAWLTRHRGRGAAATLGLLAMLTSEPVRAHEGHDHGAEPAAAGATTSGARVRAPKPSQFLVGIRTRVVELESVRPQVQVLGRVAPRAGAQFDLVAPQAGRVWFAGGRVPSPGDRITRGRALASLVVVDSLTLRSPLGGVLTEVGVTHGQRVEAGQKLLTVLDPSTVWIHADVYERDLAAVEGAREAVVVSDAWPGERFRARRVAVGATAGELPGTVEAWFEVPNPGERLRIGLPVQVGVEVGAAEPLAVLPRAAVLEDAGRTTAWVHETPERFRERPVEVVARFGDRVAVRGLLDGERVVVAGAPALAALPRLPEGD